MAFEAVSVLRVRAWGHDVGALAASRQRNLYAFEYEPAWVRRKIELSPAQMPTNSRVRTWVFPQLPTKTFHGLPGLIADSLPDRFGNAIINAALAREGVTPEAITPLDRLAYLGERAMGALTFHPDQGPRRQLPTSLELADLVTAARAALQGNLNPDAATQSLTELLSVGSSAGGARAKAVVAWNRSTGDLQAGNLPAPRGFEQWLLKFDGVENTDKGTVFGVGQEFGRIEYAYSLMARAAGVEMAETHLLEEGGRAHFMTRRFDRPGVQGIRLHMQTLGGLDGLDYNLVGTHDYASLLNRTRTLTDSPADLAQVFTRVTLNILGANNDDHVKNHSFLLPENGTWMLSPAYDITFADDPTNKWLAHHLMGVEGRFSEITRADLIRLGERYEVPDIKGILERVGEAVAHWPIHADAAGLTPGRRDAIAARLSEVARISA